MTSINKIAIGWTVGIVAVAVAIAFGGQNVQNLTPEVSVPEPPKPIDQATEPMMEREEAGAQMADPFADIADKVKKQTTTDATAQDEVAMEAKQSMKNEEEFMEQIKEGTPQTVNVTIPEGTAVPGCEENNACYEPADVNVFPGSTVIWTNVDTAAHTVTSGTAQSGPDGKFDSSLIPAGNTWEKTFDKPGNYQYFCQVHPWMTGEVTVT